MSKLAEAYEHFGLKVEILRYEGRVDPRGYDGLATMVCWHVKPLLGDEQLKPEVIEDLHFVSEEQALDHFREQFQARVILPLHLDEQSGMRMRTTPFGVDWNSSLIGFIYADDALIRRWYDADEITPELELLVEEGLAAEVEEYDLWLRGEVYAFVVHSDDLRIEDESRWAFIGMGDVRHEADATAEAMARLIARLPPTPYELVLREVSTGRMTTVIGDVEPALAESGKESGPLWVAAQIGKGIKALRTTGRPGTGS